MASKTYNEAQIKIMDAQAEQIKAETLLTLERVKTESAQRRGTYGK